MPSELSVVQHAHLNLKIIIIITKKPNNTSRPKARKKKKKRKEKLTHRGYAAGKGKKKKSAINRSSPIQQMSIKNSHYTRKKWGKIFAF
jgi:hypothetical protein